MIYGYVRHSLNNQKFIDQQIKNLGNVDKVIIETGENEQLFHMISCLHDGDTIRTGATRIKLLKQEEREQFIQVLKDKNIELYVDNKKADIDDLYMHIKIAGALYSKESLYTEHPYTNDYDDEDDEDEDFY